MGITAFSFILLPVCLIWIASPGRLLQIVLVAGVFEAAAAFTVGDLGVQPGLVPALVFLGYAVLQLLLGARYPAGPFVMRMAQPFILATIWAVATSVILPRLFQDMVYVWPQKSAPPYVQVALAPSSSNINQDVYLVLNCAILIMSALFLTRIEVSPVRIIRAYLASGFVAAAVAVWQFGNRVFHVPYPDDLFYSNPGWAILTSQSIGPVPRINGSFSEPAALATYMVSVVCATGWAMLQGNRDPMLRPLFITGLASVAISTSTTGFAALAAAGAGAAAYALLKGSTVVMARVAKFGLPLVMIGGFVFLGAGALLPGLGQGVQGVVAATMDKQQSDSYADRTSADVDSVALTVQTFGLGAGWGSNRSSSLLPGLLAGIGVPGVAMFVWFGVGLFRKVKQFRRRAATEDGRLSIDLCCGALTGFILAALLSAPTITYVAFYVVLGVLIASLARVELACERADSLAVVSM